MVIPIRRSLLASFPAIPSLKLLLDATAITGLSDGDSVSTWLDSSGFANHVTQSGTSRPVYKTNILNGRAVVRFDGTNHWMSSSRTPVPRAAINTQGVTWFAVVYTATGESNSEYIVGQKAPNHTDFTASGLGASLGNFPRMVAYDGGYRFATSAQARTDQWSIVVGTLNRAANLLQLYVNGVLLASTSVSALTLDGTLWLGGDVAHPSQRFGGDMTFVGVYDRYFPGVYVSALTNILNYKCQVF